MEVRELEMHLLNFWTQNNVEYIYKYKHRVKWFRKNENIELFTDITNGILFQDVIDIADGHELFAEEVKVHVDDLISIRESRICHDCEKEEKNPGLDVCGSCYHKRITRRHY